MQGPSLPRAAAALLLVVLLAPAIPIPSGSADGTPDTAFTPLPGLEGPRATLRLYGCADDLAENPPATMATDLRADDPAAGAPDGKLDCPGDRLHLGDAFLASAADSDHRRALGPRDQTISASVRHLPVAWFPGPGHAGGVSDLVDPSSGLFDGDDDGALDLVPPDGAASGTDGATIPVDRAPRDGRPDFAPTSTGDRGDLYFPALEARYDLTWTAGGNEPVPLPAGSSFLLPAHAAGGTAGLHDWTTRGPPAPVHWHPTPFGSGTHDDRRGALHTEPLTLQEGETVWFLDHGLRVTGFFGTEASPRVGVEVLYNGDGHEEVLEQSIILTTSDDPDRHATIGRHSSDPGNIVFADRTGIDREIPPFDDPQSPASDANWFALLSSATVGTGTDSARLQIGRVVSETAPGNAFVADQVLYRIATLDERQGAIHRFSVASLHPIGDPAPIPSAALTLAAWTSDRTLPFLPPFDRAHTALEDLGPNVRRIDGGFLAGTEAGNIGSSQLGLRPDAQTPAERAVSRDALQMQWRSTGQESRLIAPLVDLRSDARLTVAALAPARYVEVLLPDGTYQVDSVLLDDTTVLQGAAAAAATPRGHRSFLFDPSDTTPLFADADGLRLASGTIARPGAGDLVRFDPAVLHWDAYGGRIRTPDRLADQAVRMSLTYEAFAAFGDAAHPAPELGTNDTGLQDGTRGVHDNLWDTDTREPGPLPLSFAPALRTRYTHVFLDRAALEGFAPPLGGRTALLLPTTDRSSAHPGLDSLDMLGDGPADEVFLRGYWDISRSGTARDRLTTGGSWSEGNASTADLLWLQSRVFTLEPGSSLQFFDHGIRFDGASVVEGEVLPRMTLRDHQAEGEPFTLAHVNDARADGPACLAIQWDGAARTSAASCDTLQMAPSERGRSPRAEDVMWWVEVQAASQDAVTLVVNRLVTDTDRDAPGDQRRMLVGGQVYAWDDIRIDRDRVEGLVLSHVVPLKDPILVPRQTADAVQVDPLTPDERLPLLPPFNGGYTALQIHDMAVEWGEQGFLDSRVDPDDKDAVTIARQERTYRAERLDIRYQELEVEPRHHFVFLDPARGWDPDRTGTAFVNGMWADPSAGLATREGPALVTSGPDAFDEALRSGDDRGWSHRARVQIEGPASVLVDSGRLAHPTLAVQVVDLGRGSVGGAPEQGVGPQDGRLVDELSRGSGLWTLRLHRPTDLYIGHLEGQGRPTPTDTLPSPTIVPDRSPDPVVPWPSQTPTATDTQRDSPLGAGFAFLACLAVVLWMARRR